MFGKLLPTFWKMMLVGKVLDLTCFSSTISPQEWVLSQTGHGGFLRK